MTNIKTVIKADGTEVPFDAEKLNKKSRWAADRQVNWSDISLKVYKRLDDKCKTKDINKALIDVCVEAFDEKHFMLAGRVLAGVLYKEAFGGYGNIPTLKDHHDNMVAQGYWEKLPYSDEEFEELNEFMDHGKDLKSSYPEIKQIADKYVIRNRVEDRALESPQFTYMGMAMANMKAMPKDRRIEDVKKLYTYFSDKKICAPTPFMTKLRTPDRGFASCAVYTTHDTANSLASGDHIAYMMTCASSGIGSHIKTRSKGDGVRGGTTIHQGKRPYYKMVESAVAANLQNCYSDDTEVLTDKGFKLFKDLTDADLIGQVHDTGRVSFIEPLERQVYDYKGRMYNFRPERNTCMDLLVTPNHRMVWKKGTHVATEENRKNWSEKGYVPSSQKSYLNAPVFSETLAEDFEPKRYHVMFFGGQLKGAVKELTPLERLKIAFQADGVRKHVGDFAYSFHFSKDRKVERMRWILEQLPFKYTESVYSDGTKGFYIKVGFQLTKDFSDFTLEDKNAAWCKEFLREMNHWDGTESNDTDKDVVRFFCTEKAPVKFVEAVAAGCGAYCNTTVEKVTKEGHSPVSSLYISFDKNETTGRAIKKIPVEDYDGKVYCVTVPTGKIIVRRNGFSIVCGNSRGGSATVHVNVLDPEIEDIITWKSKKTAITVRVDGIHYSIGYNRLFAQKVKNGEDWMLVSYYENPDLYEAMYEGDQSKFEKLYLEHEAVNPDVKKVDARKLAVSVLIQSQESGQVYLHRTDELNRNTPFKDKIYSSNL